MSQASTVSFFVQHRRTFLGLIFGLAFSTAITYAVPPTTQYAPGATLDPTCTPGDTNCSVLIPQTQWSDVTGGINYASNVGINTPSPSALLHITGQNPNNYAQLLGGDSSNTYNNFIVRLEDNGPDNYGLTTINMSPEEGISLYAQRGVYYTNFHTNPYSSSISNQYGTQFAIEDTGNYSLVKLGDVNWNGNGSRLVINDIDKTINLGLSESSAADGIEGIQIQLDSTNHPTVKVGSTAFYGNGTNLTVDDASATISLNSGCTYFGRNYIGTVYMSDDCYGGDIGLRNGLNDESIAVYYPSTNSYRYGGDSLYVYSDSDGGFGGDIINGINLNRQFSYINFNAGAVAAIGSAGYGFRDNAGTIEYKNNGGSWSGFGGGTLQKVTDLGNTTSNEIFVNNIAHVDILRLNPINQVSAVDLFAGDSENVLISSSTGSFTVDLGTNGVVLRTPGSSFINFDKTLNSNFVGVSAGQATPIYPSPSYANFFGYLSGQAATSASFSNFLGYRAGNSATSASNSNFFGQQAGQNATNASFSNFLGSNAGNSATNAANSNFIGIQAGYNATNARNSNFFGSYAGNTATSAANSIFIGTNSGISDTVNNTAAYNDTTTFANTSILIGHRTSTAGFSNSIAIGAYATNTATNQFMIGSTTRPINEVVINGSSPYLNFGTTGGTSGYGIRDNTGTIEYKNSGGSWAGFSSSPVTIVNTSSLFSTGLSGTGTGSSATDSVFLGSNAGYFAASATSSNFIGQYAGYNATNAFQSNFLGWNTGNGATSASNSNFLGYAAGQNATSASRSNFFGLNAGYFAESATSSNFIGQYAGYQAVNASNSNFIGGGTGAGAGYNATNAANSIFIGTKSGSYDSVNNTAFYDDHTTFANTSILLGHKTSTGGFSNSIAIGAYATNTAANQFLIGSTTRPIDSTRINGSASTQCTITTGTGIACTSDERLKTNIIDLPSSTLESLLSVKTVTYNWLATPDGSPMIGFLAQDLETHFPQLVATDTDGYKSVYYAQMTPILVEAIREINTKITSINDLTIENSWRTALTSWFASAGNGIADLFAKTTHQEKLCVGTNGNETCITKEQLDSILTNQQVPVSTTIAPAVTQPPEVVPEATPTEEVPIVPTGDVVIPEPQPVTPSESTVSN